MAVSCSRNGAEGGMSYGQRAGSFQRDDGFEDGYVSFKVVENIVRGAFANFVQVADGDVNQSPGRIAGPLRIELDALRCRHPASPLRRGHEQFFRQVFGEIVRGAVHVHTPNMGDLASAQRSPRLRHPALLEVAVQQDMKVSISVLLVLKDADVLRVNAESPLHVDAELCKHFVDALSRVLAVELRGVERQREHRPEVVLFRCSGDSFAVFVRLAGRTLGAIPALASHFEESTDSALLSW